MILARFFKNQNPDGFLKKLLRISLGIPLMIFARTPLGELQGLTPSEILSDILPGIPSKIILEIPRVVASAGVIPCCECIALVGSVELRTRTIL